jgi:hypothetical protein
MHSFKRAFDQSFEFWCGYAKLRIYPNVEKLNHRRTSGDLRDLDLDIF